MSQQSFSHHQRDNQLIAKLDTNDQVNDTIQWISQHKGKILSVTPIKRTLEDIFLEQIKG